MEPTHTPAFLTLDRGVRGRILDACWNKCLSPVPMDDPDYLNIIGSEEAGEFYISLQNKKEWTFYESWFAACYKAYKNRANALIAS